jgi:hypothetical protein
MLALAIDPQAPDAAARWRAYETATTDLPVASAVREEVQALGNGARRRVTEQLLDRARRSPPVHQQRLRHAWAQRRAALAGANSAADHWRALVVRHTFSPAHDAPGRGTLATHADVVRAATRCMARVLTPEGAAQRQWLAEAMAALRSMGLPDERGPGIGLAPPTVPADQRELITALRVRQLSMMQKPLLARAWIDAAHTCSLLGRPACGDALHLAGLALNVPLADTLG